MPISFKAITRAAIVSVTLAGASLAAMPAQAAPSFSFGFHVGGGGGGGAHRPRVDTRHCLSDPQVRRMLQRNGYDHIRFTDRRGRIVQVQAERGHRNYRVTVDSCRGRIVDVDRLRRR